MLITCMAISTAISQSTQHAVVNAAGGSFTGDTYSCEWSLGELVLVNEMVANDGQYVLTNGFLQPYIKTGRTATPRIPFNKHEFRILQNPVKYAIGIQLITNESGKLNLSVYDESGHLKYFRQAYVTGEITQSVDIRNCASGNYLLKAEFTSSDNSTNYKTGTYKILKIH